MLKYIKVNYSILDFINTTDVKYLSIILCVLKLTNKRLKFVNIWSKIFEIEEMSTMKVLRCRM